MKLLIELPTWLGDAVMSTAALENLFATYPEAQITLTGSYVATEALKAHPRVNRVVIDSTKSSGFRPFNLYRLAKELGSHDIALSFRSHLSSRALLILSGSKKIYQFNSSLHRPLSASSLALEKSAHQVQRYQAFINSISNRNDKPGALKLYWSAIKYPRPTLGINPGATYGSAKRWYPEKFAEVGAALAKRFDLIIFGGAGEIDIATHIEKIIYQRGVKNIKNLAGKTSISQLCSHIAGLDLFITNDSGPMHIAAAYQIPSVAIFGPTNWQETSQWMNPKSIIIRRDIECSPCMKRKCPLKHHACMRDITPQEVIEASFKLIENQQ